MDEKQRTKEKEELKLLRRELEEKIQEIIPEELKSETRYETAEEKIENGIELDEASAKRVLEALLFAASRTLSLVELSRLIKPFKPVQIRAFIMGLKEEYEREGRSFRINEIADGFEVSTVPQYHSWIVKMEKERKGKHTSFAGLETLAILAYKQPITRVEIEELRGVDVSGVLATLLEKDLIRVIGRK
jgi:segregation and condensation protein B